MTNSTSHAPPIIDRTAEIERILKQPSDGLGRRMGRNDSDVTAA